MTEERQAMVLDRLIRASGHSASQDDFRLETVYSNNGSELVYLVESEVPEVRNAVAVFFRPTGISYDGRVDVIQRIHDACFNSKYQHRFSVKVRIHGKGAGGMEIFAHRREVYRKNPPRITLLVQDTWGPKVDPGEELGSIGWLPREIVKPCRKMVYKKVPYAFTAFQTLRDRSRVDVSSVFVGLVFWKVSRARKVAKQISEPYPVLVQRTNLLHWKDRGLRQAWVPGPEACIDDDFATL